MNDFAFIIFAIYRTSLMIRFSYHGVMLTGLRLALPNGIQILLLHCRSGRAILRISRDPANVWQRTTRRKGRNTSSPALINVAISPFMVSTDGLLYLLGKEAKILLKKLSALPYWLLNGGSRTRKCVAMPMLA
jgi:hypothetical protein